MKKLTVRLPEALVAQIETESRRRKLSKSDVVRERLTRPEKSRRRNPALLDAIADVIGSAANFHIAGFVDQAADLFAEHPVIFHDDYADLFRPVRLHSFVELV